MVNLRVVPLFLVKADAENHSYEYDAQDYAHDTHRVGNCISTGKLRVVQSLVKVGKSLLRRAESGSVGHRAVEHACHREKVLTGDDMNQICGDSSKQYYACREQIQRHSPTLEGRKEMRSDLKTYRVDK